MLRRWGCAMATGAGAEDHGRRASDGVSGFRRAGSDRVLAADGMAKTRIAASGGRDLPRCWGGTVGPRGQGSRVLPTRRGAGRPRDGRPSRERGRDVDPPPKKLGVTHGRPGCSPGGSDPTPQSPRPSGTTGSSHGGRSRSGTPLTRLIGKVADVCGLYLAPPENASCVRR